MPKDTYWISEYFITTIYCFIAILLKFLLSHDRSLHDLKSRQLILPRCMIRLECMCSTALVSCTKYFQIVRSGINFPPFLKCCNIWNIHFILSEWNLQFFSTKTIWGKWYSKSSKKRNTIRLHPAHIDSTNCKILTAFARVAVGRIWSVVLSTKYIYILQKFYSTLKGNIIKQHKNRLKTWQNLHGSFGTSRPHLLTLTLCSAENRNISSFLNHVITMS